MSSSALGERSLLEKTDFLSFSVALEELPLQELHRTVHVLSVPGIAGSQKHSGRKPKLHLTKVRRASLRLQRPSFCF